MTKPLPSLSSLRKIAKRYSRIKQTKLNIAQKGLAEKYNYPSWEALVRSHSETRARSELEEYARLYLSDAIIDPTARIEELNWKDSTFLEFLSGQFDKYSDEELHRCVSCDEPGNLIFGLHSFLRFERRIHIQLRIMKRIFEIHSRKTQFNCHLYDYRNRYCAYLYIRPIPQRSDDKVRADLMELDPTESFIGTQNKFPVTLEGSDLDSKGLKPNRMQHFLGQFMNACEQSGIIGEIKIPFRFLQYLQQPKEPQKSFDWRFSERGMIISVN